MVVCPMPYSSSSIWRISFRQAEYSACLKEIRQMLDDEYGIGHTTIQIEPSDYEHERLPI